MSKYTNCTISKLIKGITYHYIACLFRLQSRREIYQTSFVKMIMGFVNHCPTIAMKVIYIPDLAKITFPLCFCISLSWSRQYLTKKNQSMDENEKYIAYQTYEMNLSSRLSRVHDKFPWNKTNTSEWQINRRENAETSP